MRTDQTITEVLAAFILETAPAAIPAEVRDRTGLLLLDAVGIALSNRNSPYLRSILEVVEASAGKGSAHLIGHGATLVAEGAAELNSSAIHGSDLDPTHLASIIHPTAIAVPTALAVAEEVDADGAETLAAIAVGMEALIRLGLGAGGRLHVAGYQATALLGPVVAAMITARLRRRPHHEAVAAAGLATAIAAGLRSFSDDGTWGKRLITGWACRGGIHTAALAASGWPGTADGVEKRWGLLPAYLREPIDRVSLLQDLGVAWMLTDTEIKRYPCSHGLHPFIDSALAIREAIGAPKSIAELACHVNSEAARWWFEPTNARYRPDAYGARFSLPYVVARALLDGHVDDRSFSTEAVSDPRVISLVDRVVPLIAPALDGRQPVGLPGGLEVRFDDGRRLGIESAPRAGSDGALVRTRFRHWAREAVGIRQARRLELALDAFAHAASVREVIALTVPSEIRSNKGPARRQPS